MFDTNALEQIKRIPQTKTTTFLDKQNPNIIIITQMKIQQNQQKKK
jgi:hypothetical protein